MVPVGDFCFMLSDLLVVARIMLKTSNSVLYRSLLFL
jgi:hypothetical protein